MVQPNFIVRFTTSTKWCTPGPERLAVARLERKDDLRIFTLYVDDGSEIVAHFGRGNTARDAYRDANHNHRYAKHTIEGLLKKRRQSVRRELDYRAKLKLAGHCLDMTCVNFELELTVLRDEKEDLERQLADSQHNRAKDTAALLRAEKDLQDAVTRVRSLENDGNEKDKGMALVREALEEAGITQGNVIERIKALAVERDQYRLAAQQNAAATA